MRHGTGGIIIGCVGGACRAVDTGIGADVSVLGTQGLITECVVIIGCVGGACRAVDTVTCADVLVLGTQDCSSGSVGK